MVAGEGILDQVHRLFEGHNHFVFGVTFKSTLVSSFGLKPAIAKIGGGNLHTSHHNSLLA